MARYNPRDIVPRARNLFPFLFCFVCVIICLTQFGRSFNDACRTFYKISFRNASFL